MTTVYRFQSYSIATDQIIVSRRWATKEAIEHVGGQRLGEGVDVDERLVGAEIDGMTEIDFNPFPRRGFQTKVT